MTALDLVSYSSKSGGISNVVSVLAELAESIDFSTLDAGLLKTEPRSTVQRLGHLLENTLGEIELAETLYKKCQETGLRFSRTNLVTGQPGRTAGAEVSLRWEVENRC